MQREFWKVMDRLRTSPALDSPGALRLHPYTSVQLAPTRYDQGHGALSEMRRDGPPERRGDQRGVDRTSAAPCISAGAISGYFGTCSWLTGR
jgi:hypothetical protein